MEIIQIVPRLPPSIDGVGDYAYSLALALRSGHNINTQFVVCDPQWKTEQNGNLKADIDGFKIFQLKERNASELLRVLSQPGMPKINLLQYVGYGYGKRGCPAWLLHGLDRWRKQHLPIQNRTCRSTYPLSVSNSSAERRLATMFHELYAFGPPWRSSFWISPVHRYIARSLARNCDHCLTSCAALAKWLADASAQPINNVSVLPVPSNVGEPEYLPDWSARAPRMMVFGSYGQRRKIYWEHRAELELACQTLGLREIVDIGATLEIPPLSVPLFQRGILPAPAVSREMLNSRAGFIVYPTAYFGKSSIFSAYAAHGLTTITVSGNSAANEDGLRAGEHYLYAGVNNFNLARDIAGNARLWYWAHNVKQQARSYAAIIQNLAGLTVTESRESKP